MELLTAAQMRAVETEAIESGRVTGLELMERAGQGVVAAIFEEWPELAQGDRRAVVLCGPGNNGGDGFVVARLLHDRGWRVEVFLYGNPDKLPPDAAANKARWSASGQVSTLRPGQEHPGDGADLIVDAIFGTGLKRPVEDMGRVFLGLCEDRQIRRREKGQTNGGLRVVAVDLPSGICSDSGRPICGNAAPAPPADQPAAAADLTVAFHALKLGHVLDSGPIHCGRVKVVDIGLEHSDGEGVVSETVPSVEQLSKRAMSHKYSYGHAFIVAGGPGKTGAARLAARGALRIGAGLVTLACPLRALPEAAAQVTSIMLAGLDGPSGLAEILEDERLNAICLGPGLGLGQVSAELVRVALETGRPCVLDADALSRFQRTPERLFGMLHERCVLTPHGGEFARLFPDIAERLNAPAESGPAFSKVDAAREAAARAGCVILFKGPDTVLADPAGNCSVNSATGDRAAPWLATAGAGDVLAGVITGLLARGFAPMRAAETAAWLHVECARSFGPGLIAEDLPEELPWVLAALQATG